VAFGGGTNCGVSSNKSGATSFTLGSSAAASAGQLCIVAVAMDNVALTTGSGPTGQVTSLTDTKGNVYQRAYELTTSGGGANNGADIAVFWSIITTGWTSAGANNQWTANFSASVTVKVMAAMVFTVGAGKKVALDGFATHVANTQIGATTITVNNMENVEHLMIDYGAVETNSTGVPTQSGWTSANGAATTGGGATANMCLIGMWSIQAASTSKSSTYATSTSGDFARVLLAFKEVDVEASLTSDDFDDNSKDAAKWGDDGVTRHDNGNLAISTGGTASETSQQTEVTPTASSNTGTGRRMLKRVDLTDGVMRFCKVNWNGAGSANNQVCQFMFNEGLGINNFGFNVDSSTAITARATGPQGGGINTSTSVLASAGWYWFGVKWNSGTDEFEFYKADPATAADPPAGGDWVSITNQARAGFPIQAVMCELGSYFGASTGTPVAALFDGFNGATSGTLSLTISPATSASQADNITLSPKTTLSMNPAVSATQTSSPTLGTTLSPNNAVSATLADNVTLSPKTTLTPNAANSSTLTDNVTLSPKTSLTVQAATSASQTDNVVITPRYALSVNDALSATLADNVTITANQGFAVQGAVSLTQTTSPTLTPHHILTMNDAVSATQTSSPTLQPKTPLTVNGMISASLADNVTLASKYVLSANGATSLTQAANVTLASKYILSLNDAVSATQTTSPTLSPKTTLTVQAATSLTQTGSPVLSSNYALSVNGALSATTTNNVTLTSYYGLVVDNLISPTILEGVFFANSTPTTVRIVSFGAVQDPTASFHGGANDRVASLMSSGEAGRTAIFYQQD
jgi:hypothetical protein